MTCYAVPLSMWMDPSSVQSWLALNVLQGTQPHHIHSYQTHLTSPWNIFLFYRFQSYYNSSSNSRAPPASGSRGHQRSTVSGNDGGRIGGRGRGGRGRMGGRSRGGDTRSVFRDERRATSGPSHHGGRGSGNRSRGAPSNRGSRGGSNRRAPLSADRLDRDLDSYMLRDKSTGAKMLDADLDSYMMGAGSHVVSPK